MKTFKLVALEAASSNSKDTNYQTMELIDGLIINKENEENHWIIEALLPNTYLSYFEELSKQHQQVKLQATISKKSNAPANFSASIIGITKMKQHFSVLFKGLLTGNKAHSPEMILEDLIEQGLSGDALLQEFKRRLYEKRKTRSSIK
ncbi:YwpF-like family protein [Bacillus songklensis]|uniref:YwpF-like family protein n=1 Tax=Bacillus songklensis TaxID=1069116 RepID=A0ABV8B7Z6_9BACI